MEDTQLRSCRSRGEAMKPNTEPARAALEQVRAEIDARWREYLDGADAYDDEGAHVGLARHSRAVAEGLGQAHTIVLHALAAREKTT